VYKEANGFEITGSTRVFALIGDPVVHSLSPSFWNAAFRHSGTDAVYVALQVSEKDVMTALSGLQAMHFSGINVTRPLKRKAAEFCRILHEPARITGVVNTIRFCHNGAEGWNTDVTGLQRILSRLLRPDSKALVMGNGASAITALRALESSKVKEAFQIARSFSEEHHEYAHQKSSVEHNKFSHSDMPIAKLSWNDKNFSYAIRESDIIINTTPLGWSAKDFVPELDKYLEKTQVFVDFNYAPNSQLAACARKNGCLVIDGRELLFEQGLESFRLLTDSEAPADVIRHCIYS
jgi:shikimate dehydrogenase